MSDSQPRIEPALDVLSWVTSNEPTPFATLILIDEKTEGRVSVRSSVERYRVAAGNTGAAYERQVERIMAAAQTHEHFAFALSLYSDALREENTRFRICRFFACLECLAASLKGGKRGSRRAIRDLLGYADGAYVNYKSEGKEYRYDRIEVALRIRNKLFHGALFREQDLNVENRAVFDLFMSKPHVLAEHLQSDCEREIKRWANGESRKAAPTSIRMPASDPFGIRPARAGDRALVLALVPRLRAFGPPPLRPPEALDAGERRTLDRFFDAPPDGAVLWVAEGPLGGVLGAAYAEPAVDYFTQESHGHLGILAVAAEAEGHGVGRALIATVELWAAEQGYRFVTLNVFPTNERATAVYERAGYRPDTVRYVKELRPLPGQTAAPMGEGHRRGGRRDLS